MLPANKPRHTPQSHRHGGMGDDARQHAAFTALEELLEPETRTLQHVLRTSRPLSGEEFEQVTAPAV